MRVDRGRTYVISDLTIDQDIAMAGYVLTGLGAPAAQDESLRYGRAEIRAAEIAAAAAILLTQLESAVCSETEAAALIAAQGLTVAEAEVFNGNSPTPEAWTDLDLSAVVGENAALVLLKITHAGEVSYAVRKNGDADEYHGTTGDARGVALGESLTSGSLVLLVTTDTTGKIEWYCGLGGKATVIDIIAYIK